MIRLVTYKEINQAAWEALVEKSPYATWFQTPEAYEFYTNVPREIHIFGVGVEELVNEPSTSANGAGNTSGDATYRLTGLCIGYITRERCHFKQFFTRRAIILGGPLLAEDISNEALTELLRAIRHPNSHMGMSPYRNTWYTSPIYIEVRNFHDYSRWKDVFVRCGFSYKKHLNFHVDTTDMEAMQSRIGKHRWRYIRHSMRDGATIEYTPTLGQVQDYYAILQHLYATKVRTPLFSWYFFEQLYYTKTARFVLVKLDGKIVGGVIFLCLPGKAIYEWYACGIEDCRDDIRPLSVAVWAEMHFAAQKGYPMLDFMGAGKPDKPYGVRDFKAEFGGTLVEHGRFLRICKPLLYLIGLLGVWWLKNGIKFGRLRKK